MRTDLPGAPLIPAQPGTIVATTLSTTLGIGTARVQTVEHLMAAVAAVGVDNLRVEVEGPELPILDGSAEPFVSMLQEAEVVAQKRAHRRLRVLRPIMVEEGPRWIRLEPADRLSLEYTLTIDHPLLLNQRATLEWDEDRFAETIAPARTFCLLRDVDALHRRGMARGGSLENAIVLGENGLVNRGGLRYPNEFARHKMLDLVGDLRLLGWPLLARVTATGSGHTLHAQLVRRMTEERDTWVLESAPRERLPLTENYVAPQPI